VIVVSAVDGRRIRYRVTGEGPPVVLLHGIGRSLDDWAEQHDLLGDQYRLYSLDLPGFGETAPLDEAYGLPALARFVERFVDAVGIDEPAHFVGNSLGGAVAMQVAVDAPERVRSLVLVSSAGFGREVTVVLRILAIQLNAAHARLPHAQTQLFADTGHLPQIERADEFSRLVMGFWESSVSG
jgi:pimeloyl-ACP methyl ester carboxylesterase